MSGPHDSPRPDGTFCGINRCAWWTETMNRALAALLGAVQGVFADSLLPKLLVGVILAALFFGLVLGADPAITIGVLVIGGITACLERSNHRN
jgi:hypothetical protein